MAGNSLCANAATKRAGANAAEMAPVCGVLREEEEQEEKEEGA